MHAVDLSGLETNAKILKYSDKGFLNFFHAVEMISTSTNDSETGQGFSALRTKAQGWGSAIVDLTAPSYMTKPVC